MSRVVSWSQIRVTCQRALSDFRWSGCSFDAGVIPSTCEVNTLEFDWLYDRREHLRRCFSCLNTTLLTSGKAIHSATTWDAPGHLLCANQGEEVACLLTGAGGFEFPTPTAQQWASTFTAASAWEDFPIHSFYFQLFSGLIQTNKLRDEPQHENKLH